MTQHLNTGLDVEQSLIWRRQLIATRKKITCEGLRVASTQPAPWRECLAEKIALICCRSRTLGCRVGNCTLPRYWASCEVEFRSGIYNVCIILGCWGGREFALV